MGFNQIKLILHKPFHKSFLCTNIFKIFEIINNEPLYILLKNVLIEANNEIQLNLVQMEMISVHYTPISSFFYSCSSSTSTRCHLQQI